MRVQDRGFYGSVVGGSGFINPPADSKTLDVYAILFIGNSITYTPQSPYWFGNWGASASKRESDYVHILSKKIAEKKNMPVSFDAINYSWWEKGYGSSRGEMHCTLESYLNKKPDLIIIELGENVTHTESLEKDFCELIEYVKNKSKAQIIMLDNFWDYKTVHNIKIRVCEKYEIKFVNLSDLRPIADFEAEMNQMVEGEDSKFHKITVEGVAWHPNDRAHKIYAQRIFACLEQ